MVNFYIGVVTNGLSLSMTQADYTYTIDGRMTNVQLPVKELMCPGDRSKCWLLQWSYAVKNVKMAARAIVYDENVDILYATRNDSVINLCGSYQNETWEEALKTLLVEALFTTTWKKCNFIGDRYVVFEKLQPVTIRMNEKLNCTDFYIDAEISVANHEIDKVIDFYPDGTVIITFTIPNSDNCNRL